MMERKLSTASSTRSPGYDLNLFDIYLLGDGRPREDAAVVDVRLQLVLAHLAAKMVLAVILALARKH